MAVGFKSYVEVNDKSFNQTVERALRAVDDLTPVWKLIAKDFYRSEKAIFKLSGPGLYPPFTNSVGAEQKVKYKVIQKGILGFLKPRKIRTKKAYVSSSMSPYQIRKKKRYGFDYPLLKASGKLEGSVTDPAASGAVLAYDKKFLFIGTSLPYGIYHQSDSPRKKIPLRKFLFIGPESSYANADQKGRLKRWSNTINNYVLRAMGAPIKDTTGDL